MPNLRIGIHEPGGGTDRPRLMRALSQAFDVEFERVGTSVPDSLHALIVIGADAWRSLPGRDALQLPVLVALQSVDEGPGEGGPVAFSASAELPVSIRGHSLDHRPLTGEFIRQESAEPLARLGDDVLWARDARPGRRRDFIVRFPDELANDERLLDRIVPGRFIALLPVVSFLRSLRSEPVWQGPGVSASFIVDDPNLHRPRYGPIHYEQLAGHAREHGYHLSIASVPLDGWHVDPRAARVFKHSGDQLSILMHGNNHTRHEWANAAYESSLILAAQALRRVAAIESRHGVHIARVMVAPHERCSEPMCAAMWRVGYTGICHVRALPWKRTPAPCDPLEGWHGVEFAAGGLAVVPRNALNSYRQTAPLRAFLGHPINLYFHAEDLGGGYDVLAEATAFVNSLADAAWKSAEETLRGSVHVRVDGDTLTLRPGARDVEVPFTWPQVRTVRVELPETLNGAERYWIEINGERSEVSRAVETPAPVQDGPRSLRIRIYDSEYIDPATVSAPPWSPWPIARRVLAEARDRMNVRYSEEED